MEFESWWILIGKDCQYRYGEMLHGKLDCKHKKSINGVCTELYCPIKYK